MGQMGIWLIWRGVSKIGGGFATRWQRNFANALSKEKKGTAKRGISRWTSEVNRNKKRRAPIRWG